MISNVNFNLSANIQALNKQADDKLRNESNSVATLTADRNEVSVDANAIVDVFSVNFWSRGIPEPFDPAALQPAPQVSDMVENEFDSEDKEVSVENSIAVPGNREYKPDNGNEAAKSVDITVADDILPNALT